MKLDTIIAERKHKIIYRDGDLVAKVFDESFPKSDILNEALNQARVEETGLNIPKIEEVTKIDGKWAIISDYIEGKTLKELMDENPDKIDEYMNLFVD
ncbi:MAG: aminoglycoside phosphotransferase, partial [Ruminococcus sp.]|nr:aminoglycoside phosphotransferase [Ruminococcus sp.]